MCIAEIDSRYFYFPAAIMEDQRLSWTATGLLIAVFSKGPDWPVTLENLRSTTTDSTKTIKKALALLVELGYARVRSKTEWDITDTPNKWSSP